MAAGTPRSGRCQLLRAIAASAAVGGSRADVHIYGIDCGSGALLPLDDLPHRQKASSSAPGSTPAMGT